MYEKCKKNEFKHPVTKQKLPKISYITQEVMTLYNLMKIGVKFDFDNMMNTSNKIISLLQVFTSRINEKNMKNLEQNK